MADGAKRPRPFYPIGSSYLGACRVPLFNLVCHHVRLSVCLCLPLCCYVRKSCTRPMATKPGFMESREYGPTRETCSFARPSPGCRGGRAAAAVVACSAWGGFFPGFSSTIFFFERTRPAASVKPPRLIYVSTTCVFCDERQRTQSRTLEVSLFWAREAMAMTTFINVFLYVLSL